MTQKDSDQYRMDLGPKPKGKINVGYEASSGNDTPRKLTDKQEGTAKRSNIDH
jgi:hypothetical protein